MQDRTPQPPEFSGDPDPESERPVLELPPGILQDGDAVLWTAILVKVLDRDGDMAVRRAIIGSCMVNDMVGALSEVAFDFQMAQFIAQNQERDES